jgi:hypothetical protein
MKLTEFENPVSGSKGSVFDVGKLWSMILGVGVIFVVINIGQKLAGLVAGRLPGGVGVGLSQPLVAQPQAASNIRLYGCQ